MRTARSSIADPPGVEREATISHPSANSRWRGPTALHKPARDVERSAEWQPPLRYLAHHSLTARSSFAIADVTASNAGTSPKIIPAIAA
ncbi:MAG: hypothetical protein ABJF01_22890 [bacterium]